MGAWCMAWRVAQVTAISMEGKDFALTNQPLDLADGHGAAVLAAGVVGLVDGEQEAGIVGDTSLLACGSPVVAEFHLDWCVAWVAVGTLAEWEAWGPVTSEASSADT